MKRAREMLYKQLHLNSSSGGGSSASNRLQEKMKEKQMEKTSTVSYPEILNVTEVLHRELIEEEEQAEGGAGVAVSGRSR
tara:strand:- start:35520 stop:35759 length:240 start_codon:yes stop_codon:yes gene_type:complete